MSRWICVDDICIPSDENDWEELVAFADAIAEQESIDICFCRECKHWKKSREYSVMCCMRERPNRPMNADDFCSYGQKGVANDTSVRL